MSAFFHAPWSPASVRAALSPCITILLVTAGMPLGQAASNSDRFAAAERAHYSTLCRTHKDLSSCSDAVRWSPGDPVLVVALADALARAGRLQEAIRDYRRAAALDANIRGLDAKINAAEAKLAPHRLPRKALIAHDIANASPAKHDAASTSAPQRYSNLDPETQSH